MPKLYLKRIEDVLTLTFGENSASIPFSSVGFNEETSQQIYEDAEAYGRNLFEKTFNDQQLRASLLALKTNERLILIADDPSVAAIPWEYLRDSNGKLLASRLNVVRSTSQVPLRESTIFTDPLKIVAVPVSPVNDSRFLNTNREWLRLVEVINNSAKTLTLARVRPPTLAKMESLLSGSGTTIIHFMGHSDSLDGKGFLVFEDVRGCSHLIDAEKFVDSLDESVFLVVLNSCRSAVVTTTEFGNIASACVRSGVPYAIGMQFVLPDNAALELSRVLYDFLFQGRSIEEAVRRTRRAIEDNSTLQKPLWLAGIPVLYTSQQEPPLSITISAGRTTIQPNPKQLQKSCDLTALPETEHFVGREQEISETLDVLLSAQVPGFVVLHGLGGIGKTALARVLAERVSWHYNERVLAVSFETFARPDTENQLVIDEQFPDRFYNQLARFYDIDPSKYSMTADLQRAILQQRIYLRSLLVLDNVETLIEAQRQNSSEARSLATFISRLKEGDGSTLLTSRILPPLDWGQYRVMPVSSLSIEAGARLFLTLIPPERQTAVLPDMHMKLSLRVNGHPLSIRLLAGNFAETLTTMEVFLQEVDEALKSAKQATPTSLEDPERQATLYACMDFSVKRLTPEQKKVLHVTSIFQGSFLSEFVVYLLEEEKETLEHLQELIRLGLLTQRNYTFPDSSLSLLEVHSALRWYIQYYLPKQEAAIVEHYDWLYEQLARRVADEYDKNEWIRFLVSQGLSDFEAALKHISPPAGQLSLAYSLATPYRRMGQYRRAVTLYEQSLELSQEIHDARGIARTQSALADVIIHQGRPKEALVLYEQSLHILQDLEDVHDIASLQSAMATVLARQGSSEKALTLYRQALQSLQDLGDVHNVAATQGAMADLLRDQKRLQEALVLYEQVLHTFQDLGNLQQVAVTQNAMAVALAREERLQEAMELYEQALQTLQVIGDIREAAVTQHHLADLFVQQKRLHEAMTLYEQVLHTMQDLGDVREVAVTQHAMASLLVKQKHLQEATVLYEQALGAYEDLGDLNNVASVRFDLANSLTNQGRLPEAVALYEQAIRTMQDIGEVRGIAATQLQMASIFEKQERLQEALDWYERALHSHQSVGSAEGIVASLLAVALILERQGQVLKALSFYEQALDIQSRVADRPVEVTLLMHVAMKYQEIGQPQQALSAYEKALPIIREIGDRGEEAATLNHMAILYEAMDQQQALSLYGEALSLAKELEDRAGEATILVNMAKLTSNAGNPLQALELYKQVLPVLQEIGDSFSMATALNSMGMAYWTLEQPIPALERFEQALVLRKEVGDRAGEGDTLNNIAWMLHMLGQSQKALELFEQALPIRREVNDRSGEVATLSNMATLYEETGQPGQAISLYEESLPILQQAGNREREVYTLNHIALIYNEMGQTQHALALYERILTIMRELNNPLYEVRMLTDIAKAYLGARQQQQAFALYEEALSKYRDMGNRVGEADMLKNIARAYWSTEQLQQAQETYQRALSIQHEIHDQAGEAATLNDLALLFRSIGNYSEALAILEKSVTLAQRVSHYSAEAAGLWAMAMIWYQNLHRPQEAVSYMERAITILEENDLAQDAAANTVEHLQYLLDTTRGDGPSTIPPAAIRSIVNNTVAVMATVQERRAEWHSEIQRMLHDAQQQGDDWHFEVDFFTAVLEILDGRSPSLPSDNPYMQDIFKIELYIAIEERLQKDDDTNAGEMPPE